MEGSVKSGAISPTWTRGRARRVKVRVADHDRHRRRRRHPIGKEGAEPRLSAIPSLHAIDSSRRWLQSGHAPILDDVRALQADMVALRRELHQHPELAYAETRTAGRVAEILRRGPRSAHGRGRDGRDRERARRRGPAVLLRADMDALPIQEESKAPYVSREPGRCTPAATTATWPWRSRRRGPWSRAGLAGSVRVLFQPAEEGEGGAQAVIRGRRPRRRGRRDGRPSLERAARGTIGVKDGPLMAAVDRLRIVVHGRGGHGGKPHRAADPIVAAAQVVVALQTIVAREVSPVEPAVVTIGAVHGGQAFNVIPDEVVLTGTIRTFDPALRVSMPERITRVAQGVAQAMQCRAEVEVKAGNPPVLNHPDIAALAHRAAVRVVGEDKVVCPEPTDGRRGHGRLLRAGARVLRVRGLRERRARTRPAAPQPALRFRRGRAAHRLRVPARGRGRGDRGPR
jgi:amidohydrolase